MTDGARVRSLWRRGQHGWPAAYPLAQFPNAPLLLALAGSLLAGATDGAVHDLARATFHAGLAAWAWLELTAGVNAFRRVLGLAGLVLTVVGIAGV
ncbi:MAG TPA: hypothetical protein VN238_17855 [Solirubrobacteraceae bacterium]|nr:hypothetical protein [Solirubrobacteraceae bacterium]